MYELFLDQSEEKEKNVNALWEIQLKDSLKYQLPTYDQVFLFKHVATGCFLAINPSEPGEIILTYEGMRMECLFNVKSKKAEDQNISYSESLRIQSNFCSSQVIMCSASGAESGAFSISFTPKQLKQNSAQTLFLLEPAAPELANTANRICSLSIYLFQVHMFIQDWGMELGNQQRQSYDYNRAFNTQKALYDQVL